MPATPRAKPIGHARSVSPRCPLAHSSLNVDLALDYRQKGLLWFSTYRVGFHGEYRFSNDSDEARIVDFAFPSPPPRPPTMRLR